jgi:hypothetical protein
LERSLSNEVAELAEGSSLQVPIVSLERITYRTVEISEQNLSAREEQGKSVSVEEYFKPTLNSHAGDAFTNAFSDLLTRKQASSWPVARWFGDKKGRRHDCRPSLMDFSADLCIAARESLTPGQYRVFTAHLESEFIHWNEIDRKLRKTIMERVGQALLAKRIVVRRSTREYFNKNLQRAA